MKLGFVSPEIKEGVPIAKLQRQEVHRLAKVWENAVVVYPTGDGIILNNMHRYVRAQWPEVKPLRIVKHKDGYYVVQLGSTEEREKVLRGGPYFMNRKPVVVKKWDSGFDFAKEILRALPVWVRMVNLPLHCWGEDSLSRIGSLIGIPLFADDCTSRQRRLSYARIMVEVDATQELVKVVNVEDVRGVMFKQAIEYEWVPEYCRKCCKVGHVCGDRAVVVQKWIPKVVNTPTAQGQKESMVTPEVSVVEVHSEDEGGFVPATKIARQLPLHSQAPVVVQGSSFVLLQQENEEAGAVEQGQGQGHQNALG